MTLCTNPFEDSEIRPRSPEKYLQNLGGVDKLPGRYDFRVHRVDAHASGFVQ